MGTDITLPDEVSGSDEQHAAPSTVGVRVSRSFRRDTAAAGKLLAAVQRKRMSREALEIARLIEYKLSREVAGVDDEAQDDLDRRVSFVRHRFTGRLVSCEKSDHWYGLFDTVLNVLSILAGASSAILAATEANKWPVVVLGAVVAILQSVSQWVKPARRASRRSHAAARLRDEGWDFVFGQDRYKTDDINRNWPVFYGQVNRIAQQEEAAEEQEASRAVIPSTNGTS